MTGRLGFGLFAICTRHVSWLCMIVVLSLASPALSAERVALVIGMSRYQTIAPLKNTVSDAQSIAAMLEKLDFSVDVVIDQPLAAMQA